MKNRVWGYLRETEELAVKAGIDEETGLCRTGLDTYLKTIFPDVDDWVHDKTTGIVVNGKKIRNRPDYRSEKLKLIVEFDGLPHYQNPEIIANDYKMKKIYTESGYKCIRIPYFIQLTKHTAEQLFNVKLDFELFDLKYHSLGVKSRCSPAYLCPLGIERMAYELRKYGQFEVNINYLESQEVRDYCGKIGIDVAGAKELRKAYSRLASKGIRQ